MKLGLDDTSLSIVSDIVRQLICSVSVLNGKKWDIQKCHQLKNDECSLSTNLVLRVNSGVFLKSQNGL